MRLPDEPHHLPAFRIPSNTDFLHNLYCEKLQEDITKLLQLSIGLSGGFDLQEKLTGLYYVHCIIPSFYWNRYTESLHCAVCSQVLM